MLVYRVKNDMLNSQIVWDNWQDALDEIKSMLVEDFDVVQNITLSVEVMSEDEFDSLPEFEGY